MSLSPQTVAQKREFDSSAGLLRHSGWR